VLDDLLGAVQPSEKRTRDELDRNRLVLERAGEQRDDGGAARTVLGVNCISDPGEVPSVLDQHVLIAASSPDQRYVPLASFPHDRVGRLRIAIRGAWPDDDRRSGAGDPGGVTNRICRHDAHVDGNASIVRRVSERCKGRTMEPVIGRQIDQHGDDYGAHQ
jgi:hypothetical protein